MVCGRCGDTLRRLYSLRSREVEIVDGKPVQNPERIQRRELHVCLNKRCREQSTIRSAA